MRPPANTRILAGARAESKSFTFLLVLQLVLVALLVAVQYPQFLARFSKQPGRGLAALKAGRRSLKPGGGGGRASAALGAEDGAPPAPHAVPTRNTVWEPACQLPEDVKPGHGAKAFVDISVSSEFGARTRRDAIRGGYGKYARELGMRVRFFVGQAEDEHGATARAAEARQFNDLVVLPMMDTYENLTLKTMGMGVYSSKCGNGDFYVKVDDDVFVYPWRLRRRLEKVGYEMSMYQTALGVYIGNFWVDSRPIRETWHKNYEPRWKGEHFGPYAAGPFYILSKGAVCVPRARALIARARAFLPLSPPLYPHPPLPVPPSLIPLLSSPPPSSHTPPQRFYWRQLARTELEVAKRGHGNGDLDVRSGR
jgi:hypothetical protein